QPAPLAPSPKEGGAPHVGRLRATLSEWYYGDRVDVEDVEPEPERESVAQTEASAEAVERDAYSGEPER
ncbi:ubiquinol-cytochrome c reductase cytochrome b subunit, partial [Streptomyces violaceoruber]